jgi:hypothetical protein
VWLDPQSSAAIFQACEGHAKLLTQPSPITLRKALKNEKELNGMRAWYVERVEGLLAFGHSTF